MPSANYAPKRACLDGVFVTPALDLLRAPSGQNYLQRLAGRRVGLLTNHTGRAIDGTPDLEVLQDLGLEVTALFSPEHGPRGILEGDVASGVTDTGLPLHSLYGKTRRPSPEMLANVDVLVCDLQDVGARFYTYFSTIANCLEVVAETRANGRDLKLAILDRPNPLGGVRVEGPLMEPDLASFIGRAGLPVRHGLTMGELAKWFVRVAGEGAEESLEIVPVSGWHRSMTWPETGLPWRHPSPNLPDFEAAAWYPGTCLLEFSGVSVGRGTPWPFRLIAAPFIDPERWLVNLAPVAEEFGVALEPVEVTPGHGACAGEPCRGVRMDSARGGPDRIVAWGLALLAILAASHPEFDSEKLGAARILVGSRAAMELVATGDWRAAAELAGRDGEEFSKVRAAALRYD